MKILSLKTFLYPVLMPPPPSVPVTLAEKTQRVLRILYHDSRENQKNGIIDGWVNLIEARAALNFIFKNANEKKQIIVNKKILAKLAQLYKTAFKDGGEGIGAGWASATIARRQIADILEADGFEYSAKQMRQNVCDDLCGDY